MHISNKYNNFIHVKSMLMNLTFGGQIIENEMGNKRNTPHYIEHFVYLSKNICNQLI